MLSTILVSLGIAFISAMIIVDIIRKKKQGKSSCGCGCSNCAMSGQCHK